MKRIRSRSPARPEYPPPKRTAFNSCESDGLMLFLMMLVVIGCRRREMFPLI